ncbi:MAG: PH domain-containing protein [Specibacter sp.]
MSVYSTPTRGLAVAAWVFCAFFAVNLLLTGTAVSVWHFLPWLLLVAWALYVLLWQPKVALDREGLTVVNILRVHRIPFGALKAVRVTQTVSFDTTAGRIPSWGAPGAGKLGPKSGISMPATKTIIEGAWEAWERAGSDAGSPTPAPAGDPDTVTRSWNVPAAVVGLVLAVLAVVSTLS